MQVYQVPKEKASVLIEMPPHEPEARFVFLSPFAQSHYGAETPSDIFNVPQAFIPLFREGGDVLLARRDAIAWVMVGEPQRTEWYYYDPARAFPTPRFTSSSTRRPSTAGSPSSALRAASAYSTSSIAKRVFCTSSTATTCSW
jgi:hypothetical protein